MDVRLAAAIAAAAAVLLGASPAAAGAAPPATAGSTAPSPAEPEYLPPTPAGYAITAREAVEHADTSSVVAEQSERYGRLATVIQAKNGNWQVGYKDGDNEVAQVTVDGATGGIREAWTGYQVAWPMARGYEGQFGHKLNAAWVWLPLCALFLCLLCDWRRPLRIVHLDLLVLLGFGVSHVYFNQGEIGVSVPLVYPFLLYLLARMLWLGFRGGEGLRPSVRPMWLIVAAVFLIAFRITLNVADSGVIDVGYSGTIGADRITHGEAVYGEGAFPDDNRFGDTYGPANYYAYVPFELALPWSGEWDELPASHAAALAFDLATVLGLVVFGLRSRPGREGRSLAAILAFGWVAYPYTGFALQSNSNDSLIAALIVWALALFARPVARGAFLALAAMAKFAPLILAPLFAAGERGLRPATSRPALAFAGAFAVVCALMLAHPAVDPGLATFWERTAESQLDRTSPFSVWGQADGVQWLQTLVLAAAAALAIALAFVPARRSTAQVAALAAGVLIALQLGVDHWFYLYIPWFFGPLLIALATSSRLSPAPVPGPARSTGLARRLPARPQPR
ncbi:MAG TPA: glycosyltransferase 87 family protein [Solirubrobacterales bacterium]|nr:glycosyltransferase 87 family protein [Solirubrobacterales bacterium]